MVRNTFICGRFGRYTRLAGVAGACIVLLTAPARAQSALPPPPAEPLTLPQALRLALQNQPALRQAAIDEATNETDIGIGRAGWLPQVELAASAQHYFGLPFAVFPNAQGAVVPIRIGLRNTSTTSLNASQVLFNTDVLRAARGVKSSREYFQQNTQLVRIGLVRNVSKAFYATLLADRQVAVFEQDIARLRRSLRDASERYNAGLVDKTDVLQADIALNTSLASRKQSGEAVKAQTAVLRELLGLENDQPLALTYDTLALEAEAFVDTTGTPDAAARVEVQQLQTQRRLLGLNVDYYRYGFLPTVAAFGTYNVTYQNNEVSELYSRSFPNSYAGVRLAMPVFQGTRRLQNLRRSRLLVDRLDQDVRATRYRITAQFATARAAYVSAQTDFVTSRRNRESASEVLRIIDLQYREGLRAYLDVFVAQTTLRTAQLTYYAALFRLLSTKVDLLEARGELPTVY